MAGRQEAPRITSSRRRIVRVGEVIAGMAVIAYGATAFATAKTEADSGHTNKVPFYLTAGVAEFVGGGALVVNGIRKK